MRRLNRYVEENAPWKLAKDATKADELRLVLRTSPRACASLTVLLTPYIPETAGKLLDALGAPETDDRASPSSAPHPGGQPVEKLAPALPASRSDRQPHPPRPRAGAEAELVAEAKAAGVTRMLTIGMDGDVVPRGARAPPRPTARCSPPSAATPTRRPATTTPRSTTCASSRAPACRAIGETGLDYFRDYAPRADQERAFAAQIELARETGKPLVIHTRAAEDDTIDTLADARRAASR